MPASALILLALSAMAAVGFAEVKPLTKIPDVPCPNDKQLENLLKANARKWCHKPSALGSYYQYFRADWMGGGTASIPKTEKLYIWRMATVPTLEKQGEVIKRAIYPYEMGIEGSGIIEQVQQFFQGDIAKGEIKIDVANGKCSYSEENVSIVDIETTHTHWPGNGGDIKRALGNQLLWNIKSNGQACATIPAEQQPKKDAK